MARTELVCIVVSWVGEHQLGECFPGPPHFIRTQKFQTGRDYLDWVSANPGWQHTAIYVSGTAKTVVKTVIYPG